MNNLNLLIKNLCPKGVKFIPLKDAAKMQRGTAITKKDIKDGPFPVVAGGQKPAYYCDSYNRDGETITVAGSGAYAGYIAYWNEPIFVSDAFSIKENGNACTRYLFYVLQNLQEKIYATKKGGGVPHVHIASIENFRIPIPPLPVQQEIVRILDNFTELTAELNKKLEEELAARRKQYEHYRAELLRIGVPIKLSDIAYYSRGRIAASTLTESTYVGVDNLLPNKLGKRNSECVPTDGNVTEFKQGDILIGNIRPYLKKIWKATTNGGTNGDVLPIRVIDNNVVSANYLYYVLSSDHFFTYDFNNAKGAKMPRGDKEAIMNYQFQLPSILEQQRIVTSLDRFDTLCNDLTSGLPAEIAARQKQYEYYRDKLLTFKEKV